LIYDLSTRPSNQGYAVRSLGPEEALLARAEFLQRGQERGAALPLLQQAEALAPGSARVQSALGFQHLRAGETGQAEERFQAAQRLDPNDFQSTLELGILLLRDHAPEATGLLERACALRPDSPRTHAVLAQALLSQGGAESQARALSEARRAVELEPLEAYFRINLAGVLLALDRVEPARAIAADLLAPALNPLERVQAQELKRSVDARAQRPVPPAEPRPTAAPRPEPGPVPILGDAGKRLKFSLPEKYAALGQEVLARVAEGNHAEAAAKVRAALAKAQTPEDRMALQVLLDKLRAL
jgi:Flp pilus assembly protein TadD